MFALSHIGNFSLGRSNKSNMATEYAALKKAVMKYDRRRKKTFVAYALRVVTDSLNIEKRKTSEIIKKIDKNNVTNDMQIFNAIPTNQNALTDRINRDFLAQELKSLTKKERKIIALKYGLINNKSLTNNEIGKKYSESAETIRLKHKKIIEKLKQMV